MSTVTVTFVGVCTHLNDMLMEPPDDALSPSNPLPDHYSSAIAVTARFGARLGDEGVSPHFQHLHIPQGTIVHMDKEVSGLQPIDGPNSGQWSLEGVSLYIANAQPGITKSDSFKAMPRLVDVAGQESLRLDERVAFDGRAACQFAIYGGELDAYAVQGAGDAVFAKLTVTSTDEQPQLVVTRVWNQHQSRITLKDGAKIFIFNTGAEKDTEADFMLHYFVTTWTPPFGVVLVPEVDPRVRAEKPEDGLDLVRAHLRAGLTLGCSNSNYP